MSITVNSGIKFFTDSKCLARNGASAVASTGTLAQDYILNFNKAFQWASVGSSDTITETITITFATSQVVDRIFLTNHNFKQFRITYNGGLQFANVKTLSIYDTGNFADESGNEFVDDSGALFNDGTGGSCDAQFNTVTQQIDVADYALNTAYFEFDSIAISTIEIEVDTTQVADAEKILNIFSANEELGTLSNDGLMHSNPSIDYNQRTFNNILNKPFVRKGIETFKASLRVRYASNQSDVDILEALLDREENFIVWLCGGKFGTEFFSLNVKPYRLEDIYRVQNTRSSSPSFYQNIYTSGYSNSLNVVEVA